MALIKCLECSGNVSTLASVCPHCGAPQIPGQPANNARPNGPKDAEPRELSPTVLAAEAPRTDHVVFMPYSLGCQVCGGCVAIVGALLCVGNITGSFVTFPYAGYITMSVGAAVIAMGRAHWTFDREPPAEVVEREQQFRTALSAEKNGDWETAIAIYEQLSTELAGQQDGVYAANCAARLKERQSTRKSSP